MGSFLLVPLSILASTLVVVHGQLKLQNLSVRPFRLADGVFSLHLQSRLQSVRRRLLSECRTMPIRQSVPKALNPSILPRRLHSMSLVGSSNEVSWECINTSEDVESCGGCAFAGA